MPNGTAQATPTPTPAPTYFVEEETDEVDPSEDLADALAEVALSVFNAALALL